MDNKKTPKTTHLKDDGSKTNTHEKTAWTVFFMLKLISIGEKNGYY